MPVSSTVSPRRWQRSACHNLPKCERTAEQLLRTQTNRTMFLIIVQIAAFWGEAVKLQSAVRRDYCWGGDCQRGHRDELTPKQTTVSANGCLSLYVALWWTSPLPPYSSSPLPPCSSSPLPPWKGSLDKCSQSVLLDSSVVRHDKEPSGVEWVLVPLCRCLPLKHPESTTGGPDAEGLQCPSHDEELQKLYSKSE